MRKSDKHALKHCDSVLNILEDIKSNLHEIDYSRESLNWDVKDYLDKIDLSVSSLKSLTLEFKNSLKNKKECE